MVCLFWTRNFLDSDPYIYKLALSYCTLTCAYEVSYSFQYWYKCWKFFVVWRFALSDTFTKWKRKRNNFFYKKSVKVLFTYVDLSTLSLYYIILVKKWTPWGIRVCVVGGGGGTREQAVMTGCYECMPMVKFASIDV